MKYIQRYSLVMIQRARWWACSTVGFLVTLFIQAVSSMLNKTILNLGSFKNSV